MALLADPKVTNSKLLSSGLLSDEDALTQHSNRPLPGMAFAVDGSKMNPTVAIPAPNTEYLLPEQRTLDENTQQLLSDSLRRQMQPDEANQREITNGVDMAGKNFGPGVAEFNHLGGPDNNGLMSALEHRSTRDVGSAKQQIDRNAVLQAEVNKADRASALGQQMGRYEQIKIANYQYRMSKINQEKQLAAQERAEKGALLGSILGIFGTVIGGVVGGPVGAAAGGGGGMAIGQSSA